MGTAARMPRRTEEPEIAVSSIEAGRPCHSCCIIHYPLNDVSSLVGFDDWKNLADTRGVGQ